MSNNKQHIPTGYKPSPLGIIPEDWEVKRLGEIANKVGDGIHGTPSYTDKSDYYFINGNNLNDGKIVITEATKCVPYSEYLKYKKDLTKNTILISINGSIGNIALYNEEKVMLGKSAAYITIPNYKYFYHLLQSTQVLSIFEKELTGSTIRNLSLDSIRNLKVALPSQVEIDNITRVIDLWDTAISKQTQLVEKLTLRKRGLMQQLLTAKKRLKGFEGEWKEVRLGEIGTAYGGLVNKNKEDFENGNALFITYMNVFSNGKIDIDNLGQVRILPSEKQEQVQYGDIFFTVSSETPDEVGMASVLLNEVQNTYLNSFCFGYRLNDFKSIIPVYASYLFRGDDFRKDMYKIAQGSTRFNISKTEVLNMRITIPSIEEQNAIASVLVDADKEIELANKKLAAMQAQKKGLMQVLLTGKKRII